MLLGLDFSNPRLSPHQIAAALSEANVCLLTGTTKDLCYVPVDGDPRNILPSNVACLSSELASSIEAYVSYEVAVSDSLRVSFESPLVFHDYNLSAIEAYKASAPGELAPPDQALLGCFTALVLAHVKGVRRVSLQASHGPLGLSWKSYQNYLVSKSRRHSPGLTIL